MLMQDNARAHTSQVYTTFLDDKGISVMNWLANFPDFNPIEHTWNILSRCIRQGPPYRSPGSEIAGDTAKGHQKYATSTPRVLWTIGKAIQVICERICQH